MTKLTNIIRVTATWGWKALVVLLTALWVVVVKLFELTLFLFELTLYFLGGLLGGYMVGRMTHYGTGDYDYHETDYYYED